ncbi:MAG: DMT family transporter [Candidatus Dormibacteraeota bacterium]|uniref:DMT family transporter n=1 Tax=Candidatus Amunia macphersoniae TaxID=3127014 RepID=A0A934KLL6_9BACT|nr:DMT family transporter [Candidatus Dormibacteraeota bacterium]
MAAVLALVSAICYGVSDFSGGVASRRSPAIAIVLVSNTLSLLLGLLAVALLPGSTYRSSDVLWGLAAGAVGLLGVVLLYRGLAIGPMSVVAPLTAVLSAVVPVVVGAARGERPGALAVGGIALAIPAMVLIGRESRAATGPPIGRPALVSALAAGFSFGGFYVLLAQTGSDGGAWPLVGQRAASVAILLVLTAVSLLRGIPGLPQGRTLGLAAVAGVTDFLANLAYVLATHRGLLALVAVLSSLYPATTVLLARGILGERLARQQVGGLALAGAAVSLIAAG